MKMFDLQTEFFVPLGRRIIVAGICLCWSLFEFVASAPLWGVLFGAVGIYAVWQFFLDGWPQRIGSSSGAGVKELPEASAKNSTEGTGDE